MCKWMTGRSIGALRLLAVTWGGRQRSSWAWAIPWVETYMHMYRTCTHTVELLVTDKFALPLEAWIRREEKISISPSQISNHLLRTARSVTYLIQRTSPRPTTARPPARQTDRRKEYPNTAKPDGYPLLLIQAIDEIYIYPTQWVSDKHIG